MNSSKYGNTSEFLTQTITSQKKIMSKKLIFVFLITLGTMRAAEQHIPLNFMIVEGKEIPFSSNPLINALYSESSGRELLVKIRDSEICRDIAFNNKLNQKGIALFATSAFFSNSISTAQIGQQHRVCLESNRLLNIIAQIAKLEELMIDQEFETESLEELEQTRQTDLRLVCQILKNDNNIYVQQSAPYTIPERFFKKTHAQWPSKKIAQHVMPLSAYRFIEIALNIRKENNIDNINSHLTIHQWECKKTLNNAFI